MPSQWFHIKPKAIGLRKKGWSIKQVEDYLKIPRSTLSGWFKNVELRPEQKKALMVRWKNALVIARKKAVIWHNKQKQKRLMEAYESASNSLQKIDLKDIDIRQLALSMLYLGEGIKAAEETGMGNSDPLILKFFVKLLKNIYNVPENKIRVELYIRADQKPKQLKKWWSKQLGIPLKNFGYVHVDKRTRGSKSYDYYKGVCMVRCANVAIKRKLLNISKIFCKKILERG